MPVEIKPIAPTVAPSSFETAMSFVWSNIWIIILFASIGMGLIIFLWIWRKTTQKVDPFWEDWKLTKQLCKAGKKAGFDTVFTIHSQTGLVKWGKYEGDCITKDKSYNVMYSTLKYGIIGKIIRTVFFFLRPLLLLVMREYHIIKIDLKNMKDPHVIFQNRDVLLKGISLTKASYFETLVRTDSKGNIVDDRLDIFDKEKKTAVIKAMYNLTVDFTNVGREMISLNPQVRFRQKTEGTEITAGSSSGGG